MPRVKGQHFWFICETERSMKLIDLKLEHWLNEMHVYFK